MSWSYGDNITDEDLPMILDDDTINRLEKTASDCPFAHNSAHGRPYFQETSNGWYVTCDCGVNLGPKDDPLEAIRAWNTRSAQKEVYRFREGPRAFWLGA